MKTIRAAALGAALFASGAASADPIKLNISSATNLYNGLNGLNGLAVDPNCVDAPQRPCRREPYKLNAAASVAIAVDMGRIIVFAQEEQKATATARQVQTDIVAKDHPGDLQSGSPGVTAPYFKPGSDGERVLNEKMAAAPPVETSIDLVKIKLADLNIGPDKEKQNQIPPGALVVLFQLGLIEGAP